MKPIPSLAVAAWAAAILPAQQPAGPPVELAWNPAGTEVEMSWQGEAGHTYFVEGSPDLSGWRYFDFLGQGDPAGHRLAFACPSARYFVRLRTMLEPTWPADDPDGDGLSTAFELAHSMATGLSPLAADSAGDGTPDGQADPDGDGLDNLLEQGLGLDPALADSDGDGTPDGLEDPDGDGLPVLTELAAGLDPGRADSDGDGMADGWEAGWGLDPLDGSDALADPDGDRVGNLREWQVGTVPAVVYQVEELAVAGLAGASLVLAGEDGSLLVAGHDAGGGVAGWFTAAPDPAAPGALTLLPWQMSQGELLTWNPAAWRARPLGEQGGFHGWAQDPATGGVLALTAGPDLGVRPTLLRWWDEPSGSWLACGPRPQGSAFGRHRLLGTGGAPDWAGRRLVLVAPAAGEAAPRIVPLPQSDWWGEPWAVEWCAVDDAGRAWGVAEDPWSGLPLLVAAEPDPWSEGSGEWWLTEDHFLPDGVAIDPDGPTLASPSGRCLFHGARRDAAGEWEACLVSFEPADSTFATHDPPADEPPLACNDRGEILTGSCLITGRGNFALERLWVRPAGGGPAARLADLGYLDVTGAAFDHRGDILATATGPDGTPAILRLSPAADANGDGVPDDWETHWRQSILDLLGPGIPPDLLALLDAGQSDAACAALYGAGTTLKQLHQTSATAGDGTIREDDRHLYAAEFAVTGETQCVREGTGFWPLDLPAGAPPGDTLYLTRTVSNDYSVTNSPTLVDHQFGVSGLAVTTTWLGPDGRLLAEAAMHQEGVCFDDWKQRGENRKALPAGCTLVRGETHTSHAHSLTAARQATTTTRATPWQLMEGTREIASGTEVVSEECSITLTEPNTPAQLWARYLPLQPWEMGYEYRYNLACWSDYDREVMGDAAAARAVRNSFLAGDSRVEGSVSSVGAGGCVWDYCSNTRLASLKWRWLRFNPADPFHPIVCAAPADHQQVQTLQVTLHERLAPDPQPPANPSGPEAVEEYSTLAVLAVTCQGGLTGWQHVDLSIFDPHARKDPSNPDRFLAPTYVDHASFRRHAATTVSFGPLRIHTALVPDYNRDGRIDAADHGKISPANPWRLWINDDDDSGFEEGDDVPRGADAATADCANGQIDGMRDLVDFFALQPQVAELMEYLPPDRYTYRLKGPVVPAAGTNPAKAFFRVVEAPTLSEAACDAYLKDVDTAARFQSEESRSVVPVCNLSEPMTDALKTGTGLLLVEACQTTPANGERLRLQAVRKADFTIAAEVSLPVATSGVESFFRHKNLRMGAPQVEPDKERDHPPPDGGEDRLGEPANLPDSCCNEDWLVFLHGYNVNAEQARGWHCEAFKRLFWSQNHAKFVGVSWWGDESQVFSGICPKYYETVENALVTSKALVSVVNGLPGGRKFAAGHSLGSMVVCDAIANHDAHLEHAFLLNPAIAVESFLPLAARINDSCMEPEPWQGYDDRIKASDYYRLFNDTDARSRLTWRGLLHAAADRVTVFFSPGDHVLTMLPEEMVADPSLTADKPHGSYAFAIQAQTKGLSRHIPLEVTSSRMQALARLAIDVFSGFSPSSDAGGWFITEGCYKPAYASLPEVEPRDPNPYDRVLNAPSWFAERLNGPMEYSFIERLRIDPVFGTRVPTDCDGLFSRIHGTGHRVAAHFAWRRRILAQMIPERTLPAGGAGGSGVEAGKDEQGQPVYLVLPLARKMIYTGGGSIAVYDMQEHRNGWPQERPEIDPTNPTKAGNGWRHGDIREVAYVHVWKSWRHAVDEAGIDVPPTNNHGQ